MRHKDEQFGVEKENYERELDLLRKKIGNLQDILETKDRVILIIISFLIREKAA